jgi:hypothetical protein
MATATTTTTTATAAATDVTPAGATLATDEVLCDTQPLDTSIDTPTPPASACRYKIELDVCNEYDATLSRTFIFTLPRTRRARRVRDRVAKIASRGYTNGNCDRIIRILKPFPCRERVTDDKRMVIRMLSSELEEEPWPCHVPVAHDDALDAEVSDWECDSSSDDEIGA